MGNVRRWPVLSALLLVIATATAVFMPGIVASAATGAAFSPSPYNYGKVATGQTATKTFTLTNSGSSATGAVTITLTPASGTPSAAFTKTADTCTGTSLGKQKSCTVTVKFAPAAAGAVTATLTAVNNKKAVLATDTLSGTGTNTVTVTSPGNQTSTAGGAVSLQIQASDSASGQTLTYSATTLPPGLSINATSGLISGTPTTAGTFNSTVTATDTTGASGSASFTWTVNPAAGPPTANAQSYTAVGNTSLAVGTTVTGPAVSSTDSLLAGDKGDASCGTLTVTGHTAPANGTLTTVNPDGTFTYLPKAGFTGTDTFQYTITCGSSGQTASNSVTITVGTLVWYVNSTAAAGGNGESSSMFSTLAAAASAAGTNSIIFLYQGSGDYTGGLTMKSGQSLFGQPHGLTVGGYTLVPAGGSNPAITNASGDGIDLASGTDVEDVNVSSPSADGINGQQVSGSISIIGCTITGSKGDGVDIAPLAGGTTAITISDNNVQTQATVYGIDVDPDGNTTLTGTLTGTITGNTVGSPTAANSGAGTGISVGAEGSFTETVAITNNNLYQYQNDSGINFESSLGSPTMNLTITGNTIADPGTFGSWGLIGDAGAATGDAGTVCADITGNSMTGSSQPGQGGADFELDQEFSATIVLPGYTGGPTATSAVVSFVQGKNGGTPSGIAQNDNYVSGGFTGGGSCPTP